MAVFLTPSRPAMATLEKMCSEKMQGGDKPECRMATTKTVGLTAEDLRMFHDALARARLAPLPPFPRATLITTEHIIDDLKRVERDLRDVIVSLGLAG